jgi:hypothetical protein
MAMKFHPAGFPFPGMSRFLTPLFGISDPERRYRGIAIQCCSVKEQLFTEQKYRLRYSPDVKSGQVLWLSFVVLAFRCKTGTGSAVKKTF